MAELSTLRTYTSKMHDNGDGTRTLEAHVGHIHYDDAGTLEDVDLRFVDQGAYWELTKASYKLRVAKAFDAPNLIRYDNRFGSANHTIYYEPHSLWWVNADDRSQRQLFRSAQVVTGTLVDDYTIRWLNAFGPGIHYQVQLQRSGFRKEIVAMGPPSGAPYANYEIGIVARWQGSGLTIKADDGQDWDGSAFYHSQERFEVRELGGAKSYIQRAYIRDSDKRARRIRVFYELRSGSLWQGKLLPKALLEAATYPIAADAVTSPFAHAADGFVARGNDVDWATAQNTTVGTAAVSGGSTDIYVQVSTAFTIQRVHFPFDTSALTAAAIISAAALYVYSIGILENDNDAQAYITLVQDSPASDTALVVGDYDAIGDAVDNPTEGTADQKDTTNIPTGQYINWVLNATGLTWINKTGYTHLGLREGHDVEDIAVTGRNYWYGYASEQAGTGNDPYLSVTYTLPGNPWYAYAQQN